MKDLHTVYLHDEQGLHPVRLSDNVSRDEVVRAPAIVETRPAPQRGTKRSWEEEALIIGGSAGAGRPSVPSRLAKRGQPPAVSVG